MPSSARLQNPWLNPSASGFSLSWPCRLLEELLQAGLVRHKPPSTSCPFVLRHLFIIALIWSRLGPASCLDALIQMSGRMGSQSPASEHLNWQSAGQPVYTCVCVVSPQHGVCQRQGLMDATQASPGFLLWPASQHSTTAHSSGEVTERVLCFLIPAHLPLLHSQIRCLPHPQFCCKPPPGWNSSPTLSKNRSSPGHF